MNEESTQTAGVQEGTSLPRKLGDEWSNWVGQIEENNGDLTTSPWFFLGILGVALVLLQSAFGLLFFMVEPRLEYLGLIVANVTFAVAVTVCASIDIAFLCIVLTVVTGINFVPFYQKRHIAMSPILPLAAKIGHWFGLSHDRLSNSLLQVGNRLTAAAVHRIGQTELLILLPRCLDRETRDQVKTLSERYGVVAHICGGGSQARQLLAEKRPKGIIGVACERDLMSGVQDVKGKVPVIAIANKRPSGPCRNTFIDMDEMENAIRLFVKGKKRHAVAEAQFDGL